MQGEVQHSVFAQISFPHPESREIRVSAESELCGSWALSWAIRSPQACCRSFISWKIGVVCCVCGDEVFVCLGREEERKRILLFWFSRTMRRHPFSRAAEEKGKHLAKASVEPSLT